MTTFPGPVLVDVDWCDPLRRPPATPGARLEEGSSQGLVLRTSPDAGVAGSPLPCAPFADAVVTVRLGLVEGDDQDLFGLYVRQSTPERYVAFTLSAAGRVLVIEKDEQVVARLDAFLLPELPFGRGVGEHNDLALVLAGPALMLYVNGAPVSPLLVDQRFSSGFAGCYLRPGGSSDRCALEVVSARAVGLFAGS